MAAVYRTPVVSRQIVGRVNRRLIAGVQSKSGPRPELNPVEQVWGHAKYGDPANFILEDVGQFGWEVMDSLEQTASDRMLLRAFFKRNRLALCNGVCLLWRIWGPQQCIWGVTRSPIALKGRQSLARGVSPWRKSAQGSQAPDRGRQSVALTGLGGFRRTNTRG